MFQYGRVLDSRPRGRGFEPHRRNCVVPLSKTHLSLLSTGYAKKDPFFKVFFFEIVSFEKDDNITKNYTAYKELTV